MNTPLSFKLIKWISFLCNLSKITKISPRDKITSWRENLTYVFLISCSLPNDVFESELFVIKIINFKGSFISFPMLSVGSWWVSLFSFYGLFSEDYRLTLENQTLLHVFVQFRAKNTLTKLMYSVETCPVDH